MNSKIPDIGLEDIVQTSRLMPIDHEDFTVPVVLMTLGWDPSGDPTHKEHALGRDHSCVLRVLEMKRIVRWFTSHTRYDSHSDKLVRSHRDTDVASTMLTPRPLSIEVNYV